MNLTEDTEKHCEVINAALNSASTACEKDIQNIIEDYGNRLHQQIINIIFEDVEYGIKQKIKQEVESALEKILNGEKGIVDDLMILSSYRYGKLRLAIHKEFSDEINKKVVEDLIKEKEQLEKSLEIERSVRHY